MPRFSYLLGVLMTTGLLAAACGNDEVDFDDDGRGGSPTGDLPFSDDDGHAGTSSASSGAGGDINWGSPCDFDDDCPAGETCNDKLDLCGPLGPTGTPCAFDDDCVEQCNDKLDECMPPAPAGTPCTFDDDCASDDCLPDDVCA